MSARLEEGSRNNTINTLNLNAAHNHTLNYAQHIIPQPKIRQHIRNYVIIKCKIHNNIINSKQL